MLRPVLPILVIFALAGTSTAADRAFPLKLEVQVGWGEALRPGRWTPIYVTTADPSATDAKPRAVRLELQASQPQAGIMCTTGEVTVGPRPRTFTLYAAPRDELGEELVVTLRDAATGQMLALWPEGPSKERRWARPSVSNRIVAGFVGQAATRLDMLAEAADNRVAFVTLSANQLPDQAIGFDELDLLILDRPDLSRIPRDRQQAIVDWVKRGGCVLLWPGSEPTGSSPLADGLPCRVGEPKQFPLSSERRKHVGLAGEAGAVTGVELRPHSGSTRPADASAETIPLLADTSGPTDIAAFTTRLGFGRITVSPIDPGELQFASIAGGRAFYQALTRRLGVFELQPGTSETISFGADNLVRRQDYASALLSNSVSRGHGESPHEWLHSIAWILLGVGVLVGPVDAVTLRMTGRRGLTPVTLLGWVAVLGATVVLISDKSAGDSPSLGSIELIEQADGQVLSRQILASVSAGQVRRLGVEQLVEGGDVIVPQPADGNWELPAQLGWTGRGRRFDVSFRQSLAGYSPNVLNVGPHRFVTMAGQLPPEDDRPMVSAELTASAGGVLHGRIRNLSKYDLSDVRIRVGDRFAGAAPASPAPGGDWPLSAGPIALPKLAAGTVANIDLPLRPLQPAMLPKSEQSGTIAGDAIWGIAADLNARRSWRCGIEGAEGCAVIYAAVAKGVPLRLAAPDASPAKHRAFLRVLVPVKIQ